MNRLLPLWMTLVAVSLAGCSDKYVLRQSSVSAKGDLNKMDANWLSGREGNEATEAETVYNTSYKITDVHYAAVSPAAPPVTTGETTAIAVNTNGIYIEDGVRSDAFDAQRVNKIKVLEFGSGAALTSTENPDVSNPWATRLAGGEGTQELSERRFNSVKDVGNDSILAWGRWTDPRFISSGTVQAGCCSENNAAHYVFGAATPNANIPASGTATFNLIGATSPTLDGGVNPPGTLSNTSQVGVVWGGPSTDTKIGITLQGSFTGQVNNAVVNFSASTAGGAADPLNGGLAYNPASRSFGGAITNGTVSGFIAGAQATHVGLTYQAVVAAPPGTFNGAAFNGMASGAAAFKR